jgi:hypothetical protein
MGVPASLRALPIFVGWRYEQRVGGAKPTKVPYRAAAPRHRASSTDRGTWTGFETAVAAYEKGQFDGIGFGLRKEDRIVVWDLDGCRDPETGAIEPWAHQIISRLNSYAEPSPSGTGVHILIRADMLLDGRRTTGIEVYSNKRYLTATGEHLEGTPRTIEERQAEFDGLYLELFGGDLPADRPRAIAVGSLLAGSDDDVVRRASAAANGQKFAALHSGAWESAGYGSQSEAELAYCRLLAFWVGADPGRVDRIFRSSGLMRDKWDRQLGAGTYGSVTISTALGGLTEVYGTESQASPAIAWPQSIDEAALIGPIGDLVRALEPHSEADPVALLVNALVAFGSIVGSSPHFLVEADRHRMRLFSVLVGQRSKARKGTSWGHVRDVFCAIDPEWKNRIMDGLSTGEGLIYQVRDETYKKEKDRNTGTYEEVLDDPGVDDKRLLIMEGEFASVLKVARRDTNTLSAIVRNAWDTGDLRVLTRNSPLKATGAHVSILSHITKDELLRNLTATEMANGFANRFMWFCVRRSKKLPFGGSPDKDALATIAHRLADAVRFASRAGKVTWTDEASDEWVRLYDDLSEGRLGMVGAMTARGEAQVVRLAALYALTECSTQIGLHHLEAAVAVWRYSEASVRHLFGAATGNDIADTVLARLRENPGGLSRTQIRDLFSRHAGKSAIDPALCQLEGLGLARIEIRETGGRPAEVWTAA